MLLYSKIHIGEILITKDIIDEINGRFSGENGRKDGMKLTLTNTGNKANVKKKAELVFKDIINLSGIIVFFVLSFFKLF